MPAPPRASDEHSLLSRSAAAAEGDDGDDAASDTANEKSGSPGRRSTSSSAAGSSFSFFSERGDLSEQVDRIADAEDPLHVPLRRSGEAEAADGSAGTRSKPGRSPRPRRVRYVQEESVEYKGADRSIDKEAIEIPEPVQRKIGWAEKSLALIMNGDRQAARSRGLVGKPLL